VGSKHLSLSKQTQLDYYSIYISGEEKRKGGKATGPNSVASMPGGGKKESFPTKKGGARPDFPEKDLPFFYDKKRTRNPTCGLMKEGRRGGVGYVPLDRGGSNAFRQR